MKGQRKIIGQKIVKIENFDEYIVATLENGMEIEIADIRSTHDAKILRVNLDELCELEKKHSPMIGRK
jgi:hypothetical protein